jgi:murein DD-endopeptidase MepM/ murein hydrolase activator NlpD
MKELIHSFPTRHKMIVVTASLLLFVLALWPADEATAHKNTESLVVTDYQELSIGKAYPLPLDIELTNETESEPHTEVKHVKIKSGDTLAVIFKRVGLTQKNMLEVVSSSKDAKALTKLVPGKTLNFELDADGQLQALSYEQNKMSTLVIKRQDSGYQSLFEEKQKEVKTRYFEGQIVSNFWNAGVDAGLNDNLIMNLANVFQWDVDFALDLRQGDKFYALVEQVYIDGEFVGYGEIVAAEFINQGDTFKAVRYDDGRYYTPEGDSMQKAFLRAPVNFKYISSNFSRKRFHPVQKRYKAHRGTDYAARTGTPVYAAGDGKVIKSAYDRYNGHHVFIEHGGGIVTKYIHFSKRKVKRGQRVKQGQTIGLVGQTGLAAGPHLHYEFLLNGVHRNPRTVPLPKANPISKKEKDKYLVLAKQTLEQLDHNKQLLLAMR